MNKVEKAFMIAAAIFALVVTLIIAIQTYGLRHFPKTKYVEVAYVSFGVEIGEEYDYRQVRTWI